MSRTLDHRVPLKAHKAHVALVAPLAVLAAAALVTGCSSSKSKTASTGDGVGTAASTSAGAGAGAGSSSGVTMIEVKNFSFTPDAVTVKTGSTVTWKFDDDTAHTVKADDGSFKSSALAGGKTFSFTFNKAGQYSYICSIHPQMQAKVTVQ